MLSAAEFAKDVADRAGISQADAKTCIAAVFAAVGDALLDPSIGGVRTDVGQFALVEKAARKARNPATGETVSIPAGYAVKFKFSSAVKAAVKGMKRGKGASAKAAPAPKAAPAKATAKTVAKAPAKGGKAAVSKAPAKAAKPAAKAAPAKAPVKAVAKPAKGGLKKISRR